MVEITNTQVYNLENAVVASGNAMRLEPDPVNEETFAKSLERCSKLVNFGGGSGHTNFRTGILATFDLKYEQYFTKQVQRYHFFQYVSSTSLMHRITKMDFDKCCNKYVSASTKAKMNRLVYYYNKFQESMADVDGWEKTLEEYTAYIRKIEYDDSIKVQSDFANGLLYELYMRIISECPMGTELTVHCSTNYEQLATIYRQRKNHKLQEDWGEFCKWIESLPYAKELIICQ